jgi:hypothetical protein
VFATLIGSRGYSPARTLIGEMMHYFEDVDGNFVQQFQSDGFDAGINPANPPEPPATSATP